MAKWCVRGLVAGPRLPRDSVKLSSSCSIKRITEPEHQVHVNRTIQLIADRNFIASQFGNPDVFNYTMPLTQQAESKHELSIIVTADNPPLAVKKAEEEASLYLGVLTLAVGTQRYFFSPTVARHLPDVSSIYAEDHATSGIGRATVYHAESLRVSDADYAKTLLELSSKHKALERALSYLRAAWRLGEVALDDPAIHKAMLSNCFLVLETVSNAVTKEWRKENKESTLSKQAVVVENLREKLDSIGSVSKKVVAVREAFNELQRADRYFQDLKLETAGQILGVEERFISIARDLGRIHNTKLGHAGSAVVEELEDWIYKSDDPRLLGNPGHFGKAELTAIAYLKAYSSHVERA